MSVCVDNQWLQTCYQNLLANKDYGIYNIKRDDDIYGLRFWYNKIELSMILYCYNTFQRYSLRLFPYKNLSGGNLSFSPQLNMFHKIISILYILLDFADSINDDLQYIESDEERIQQIIGCFALNMIEIYRENTEIITHLYGLEIRLYLVGNQYGLRIEFNAIKKTGLGLISNSYIALIKCIIELARECRHICSAN